MPRRKAESEAQCYRCKKVFPVEKLERDGMSHLFCASCRIMLLELEKRCPVCGRKREKPEYVTCGFCAKQTIPMGTYEEEMGEMEGTRW